MQITLNMDITNAKALALLNYIRTLDFVSIEETTALSNEQKKAVDYGIEAVEQGKTIEHDQVVNETKQRYPNLFK